MTQIVNPIPPNPQYQHNYLNRLCWSSIIGGAFVAVGLGFLLNLYAGAIGLSAYSSTQSGASAIAIGGFLGLLLGVIASMLTGGFVAGYLGRYHFAHVSDGVIYGFVTWSIALLLSAIMAGALMHYASSSRMVPQHRMEDIPKVDITTNKAATDTSIPTHQATQNNTPTKITPTELAWGGWVIFILFFVGAIASCLGACWGMCCKKEELIHNP